MRFNRLFLLLLVSPALPGVAVAAAPQPEWKDAKGATFRGEPVEVVGPLALFRTGATSSKFLYARGLSEEDCARFHDAIRSRPPRAARWSEATGQMTGEFVGRLRRVENRELKPVDLAALPEPEFLIVLFGSRRAEGFRLMMDNLAPFVSRMQRVYAGRVAAVALATRQSGFDPRSLPGARSWLVVDPDKQSEMKLMSRFVPGGGFVMLLMTREGVPLFGSAGENQADVMKFVDGASELLWQINPSNPRTARDRAFYLRVARTRESTSAALGPLLLVDPLRPDGLRQYGAARIEAELTVAAEGTVSGVQLLPESSLPEPLVAPITAALRRNPFVLPAMANGVAVAGTCRYSLRIGPANPQLSADTAWVMGEARVNVPLKSWLVLKPIHVPEQVFAGVASVGEDGTVMLQAVTAGTSNTVSTASQMNSFNSDWFGPDGAASVQPIAGQKQEVDGEKLVWKRVTPDHGLVDFINGSGKLDYCIGYAWTEFEVADERDGWLGIGSDDGLKIWLNGRLVNDKWVRRTSRLDDDVVPLALKKGRNQLLIKIQNAMGLWSFTCRLRVRGS